MQTPERNIPWDIAVGGNTVAHGDMDAADDREVMRRILSDFEPKPDVNYRLTAGKLVTTSYGDEFDRVRRAMSGADDELEVHGPADGYMHPSPEPLMEAYDWALGLTPTEPGRPIYDLHTGDPVPDLGWVAGTQEVGDIIMAGNTKWRITSISLNGASVERLPSHDEVELSYVTEDTFGTKPGDFPLIPKAT